MTNLPIQNGLRIAEKSAYIGMNPREDKVLTIKQTYGNGNLTFERG